ncbi:MAG: RDD family protein [Chloroflexi bacterium]|nr:RDD family protein [Chloroflexota bacterium]
MTDQPVPESGPPPAPDAPPPAADDAREVIDEAVPAVEETAVVEAAAEAPAASEAVPDVAVPAAAAAAVPAAAAATVAAAPAAPPPAPPPPPAAAPPSGWTPPPAAPVAGAGWAAYAQTATGPGGPAPGWEYAGFWIRAVAYILDGIILGIVTTVLWLVVLAIAAAIGIGAAASTGVAADGQLTGEEAAIIGVGIAAAFIFLGIMTLVVTVLYFVLFWVKRGGTLGQTLLGMRIAREADGAPIGWGTAIVRYVMMLISFWIFYLGVIWVAFEPRKRGWHDMVAGTVVVRRV